PSPPPPAPDGPPVVSPLPYPPGAYPAPPLYPPPYSRHPVVLADPANPSFWVGVEALLWWTKNQPLPVPLITTGPSSLGDSAGNLDAQGTVSLNGPLHFPVAGGARLFAGGWFDCKNTIGVDGSLFFLGRQSTRFAAADPSGTGSLVLNE